MHVKTDLICSSIFRCKSLETIGLQNLQGLTRRDSVKFEVVDDGVVKRSTGKDGGGEAYKRCRRSLPGMNSKGPTRFCLAGMMSFLEVGIVVDHISAEEAENVIVDFDGEFVPGRHMR